MQLPDREIILDIFFRGMLCGWPSGNIPSDMAGMPGYKYFEFIEGEFRLLDLWSTTPDSYWSAGSTTMWFRNVPIWIMQFWGAYRPEAISCVQSALLEAYNSRLFYGGRGRPNNLGYFSGETFYTNQCKKNGIDSFCGRETVTSSNISLLGWHEYRGGFLFE